MAIDTRRHDCPARFIPTRQSRLRSLTLKGRLTATCDDRRAWRAGRQWLRVKIQR